MKTNRVKNTLLLILIGLNTIIYFLNASKADSYTLSASQKNAVSQLLENGGIVLLAELPDTFEPRRSMNMSPFDFTILEDMLYGVVDPGEIMVEEVDNRTVKNHQTGRLTITGDKFIYDSDRYLTGHSIGVAETGMTEEEARSLCDGFLEALAQRSGLGAELTFNHVYTRLSADSYSILYMGDYHGVTIASNAIFLTVDSEGISRVNCSLAVPTGLADTARDIYAPDEALLSLYREVKGMFGDSVFYITGVSLVYNLTERFGGETVASPYYMFTVKLDPEDLSNQTRFYINAYTNAFLR